MIALSTLTLFTQSAYSRTLLDVPPPCSDYTTQFHLKEGSIAGLLKQDGIKTEAALFARGEHHSNGSSHPWKYTAHDQTPLLLKTAGASETVAAYRLNRHFTARFVPQAEKIKLGDHSYSAMKFVDSPMIQAISQTGANITLPLWQIISNPLPTEFKLFAILISNTEALSEFQGHNYLVTTAEVLPEQIDLRIFKRIELKSPEFVIYDNDSSFQLSLREALRYLQIPIQTFQTWLKQSPQFIAELEAYTPEIIQADMTGLLSEAEIATVIENRRLMIGLFHS